MVSSLSAVLSYSTVQKSSVLQYLQKRSIELYNSECLSVKLSGGSVMGCISASAVGDQNRWYYEHRKVSSDVDSLCNTIWNKSASYLSMTTIPNALPMQ